MVFSVLSLVQARLQGVVALLYELLQVCLWETLVMVLLKMDEKVHSLHKDKDWKVNPPSMWSKLLFFMSNL